jgi:hypothetical protein
MSSASGPQGVAEAILAHHPDLRRADIYAAGLSHGLSPLGWHCEVI